MKVDGSLKSLIQGVSQQPARSRLPGQCTSQDNMSSNPVDGLKRRPPLEYIANLFDSGEDPQFYYVDHGNDNEFIVVALNGNIRVFDLAGTEKTVNETGDAFDYLDGNLLAFTTLDDKTYIANKSTEVAMLADVADFQDYGSMVYLLGGQYARDYEVTVSWIDSGDVSRTITVTHTTPDGSSSSHAAQIATDYIANELKTDLEAVTTHSFNTTFDVEIEGDVLYINWAGSETDPFEITVNDGSGGTIMLACNNKVKDISKLPRYAPQGYHVTVSGDDNASQDDWYLEFSVEPDADGNTPAVGAGFGQAGSWIETVQKDTPYLLDVDTMPHILTYDSTTDEFTFAAGEWAGRQVGDEETNEDPSFVGRTIQDLGYFQGRLVALAGPAVIMSRTNKPLDFWIESATGTADSDAIDIESTAKGASTMERLIPHNRDLVMFSKNAQFIVFGRNALTPNNASLVLTTTFEAELRAAPVPAGRNIFFAINYGAFTGIREFYTEGSQDINDSRPITQHVLKYIEGRVRHMASTSNFDNLIVQAEDETILYNYEYIWINDQRVQSSWSRWILPNAAKYFFFVESVIYVISEIDGSFVLEQIDRDIQSDTGLTYQVKLDRKITETGVNTEIVNLLPQMPDIDDMVFIQGDGCPHPGLRVLVDDYDEGTNTITLKEDMGGGDVICGQRYTSSYKPTMPFVRDQDGVKIGTGTLIISKFFANVRDTGILEARVTSQYRSDVELKFSGRRVGDPGSVVGEAAIVSTSHTIPFRDNTDNAELEIFTNSHLPLNIMDIEWIGQYTKRGRRITQGG
jgi:hypothetical protein